MDATMKKSVPGLATALLAALALASPASAAGGYEKGDSLPRTVFEKWYNHVWPTTMDQMSGRALRIEFWATW